jgi:hypothetical protein
MTGKAITTEFTPACRRQGGHGEKIIKPCQGLPYHRNIFEKPLQDLQENLIICSP